ncbi:hypothetical protein AB0P45_10135 [Streptomyces niveus]|uniref:hypothetical protein n=1 Tax=Streptomyces niveus TaxID=193462 RepID=UPI00342C53BE
MGHIPHPASCARGLRERLLGLAGSPDPVPAALLGKIATHIAEHCGHRPLKCRRLAQGWTVDVALHALRSLADALNRRDAQFTDRSLKEWEAGRLPTPNTQDLLCQLYATGPVQLGFGHDYTPAAFAEDAQPPGGATNRRTALKVLGLTAASAAPSVADAFAFTAELERTDLGAGTLDQLDQQITHLGATYAARPAAEAWTPVWTLRRHTATLLDGHHTLVQQRHLLAHAGMLSVILAWLAHDMGRTDAALAYATDARAHGHAAESGEVTAWAEDLTSTVHLYTCQPALAATYAERGLAAAPARSTAWVRLAAQRARALALDGNAEDFTVARRAAHRAATAFPAHASGLFSADQVRLVSFDATSHLALHQPEQARRCAEDAIAQYTGAAGHSPTRAAIARLDLATAHATLGDIDAALDAARPALTSPRPAAAITGKAHALAHALTAHHHPAVTEFTDRVHTLN